MNGALYIERRVMKQRSDKEQEYLSNVEEHGKFRTSHEVTNVAHNLYALRNAAKLKLGNCMHGRCLTHYKRSRSELSLRLRLRTTKHDRWMAVGILKTRVTKQKI